MVTNPLSGADGMAVASPMQAVLSLKILIYSTLTFTL